MIPQTVRYFNEVCSIGWRDLSHETRNQTQCSPPKHKLSIQSHYVLVLTDRVSLFIILPQPIGGAAVFTASLWIGRGRWAKGAAVDGIPVLRRSALFSWRSPGGPRTRQGTDSTAKEWTCHDDSACKREAQR